MAGPLQNMLYRRPVRNAIRALLGLQPKYGYGFGPGRPGGRPSVAPGSAASSTSKPDATARFVPSAPFVSNSPVSTPPPPVAPVATAASLAAPPPGAMAQAVGFTPPDEEEQDVGVADTPSPFPAPALDRYLASAEEESKRNSQTGAATPVERANSGLFANLPVMTPTPATTAQPVQFDANALKVRAAKEQDDARRIEKARAAEGRPAQPVSQPAAQAVQQNTLPAPSAAPVDPHAEHRREAAYYRSEAAKQRGSAAQMLAGMAGSATADAMANLSLQAQQAYRESERLDNFAAAIESRIDADQRQKVAMDFEREKMQLDRKPPDDLPQNLADIARAVRQYGLEGAASGSKLNLQAAKPDMAEVDLEKHADGVKRIGLGVVLADRILTASYPSTPDDPVIVEIANMATRAGLRDARARQAFVANIVGNAQIVGRYSPALVPGQAKRISDLVEQRIRGY